MSSTWVATPGKWKNSLPYSWPIWKRVMPFLSLQDLYALCQVEMTIVPLVEMHLSVAKFVIDGADLRGKNNLEFYQYIGHSATQLSLVDTLEMDIAPLLGCFPHLRTLSLRRALISRDIKGFPVKLRELTLDQCCIDTQFLHKWKSALEETLESIVLISANESTAKIMIDGVTHLRMQDMSINFDMQNPHLKSLELKDVEIKNPNQNWECASIEYFKCDAKSIKILNDTLNRIVNTARNRLIKVVVSDCNNVTVERLLSCPNLRHVIILSPNEDQLDWGHIMKLRCRVSTVKRPNIRLPFDILPTELLLRIARYLDTEDCIALSHVNRKLRSIIFDQIYPTTQMILRTDFKRYPLDRRPYIFIEMGLRVQKLSVVGHAKQEMFTTEIFRTEIFNNINFPQLRNLTLRRVAIGPATKIPGGLQYLHLENFKQSTSDDSLNRMFRTLTYLTCWNTYLYPASKNFPSLCQFDGDMTVQEWVVFLRKNPNLSKIWVYLQKADSAPINDLIEAFKCTPNLTYLQFRIPYGVNLTSQRMNIAQTILPQLKELHFPYVGNAAYEYPHNAVSHFLTEMCADKLKILSVVNSSDAILRFKNLESLRITKENCSENTIINIIENLPNLEKLELLNMGHRLSVANGMRLIRILESSNRTLCFNKVNLRSNADLFKATHILDV